MKEIWTYKKLGELVNIRTGKLDANAADENGKYPFFTCSREPLRINTYSYDCECILVAGNGELNVKYYNGKFDAYQRTYIIEKKPEVSFISTYYIYQFFRSYIEELRKRSIGGIIKYIKLGDLTGAQIPLPPLSEQQTIVHELDLLNDLIAKKRAQVAEYDQLQQSLFYTMFGDPITNEKGWEVKTFGEIGTFQRGNGFMKKDFVENGYPCIHYGQIHTKFGPFVYNNITSIPTELVPKTKIAHFGDLIMAITSEDLEGSCKSIAWLGNHDVSIGSHAAIFSHNQDAMYLSFYTRTKAFYDEKEKYARGFKVMEIKPIDIAKISIPLPPLPLQQEFAKKVEAIEALKAKVNDSIRETETLLASRMDYYFG